MAICFDCIKKIGEEELNNIRQQAKIKAVNDGKAMAVFKEGSEYHFIEAGRAISGGYPIIEFVSSLP